MTTHRHSFTDWPFAEPVATSVFICGHVSAGGAPITYVTHDHDGDWQFLCSELHNESIPILICLGCIAERDPTVFEVADLPIGWAAERNTTVGAWSREALPVEGNGGGV